MIFYGETASSKELAFGETVLPGDQFSISAEHLKEDFFDGTAVPGRHRYGEGASWLSYDGDVHCTAIQEHRQPYGERKRGSGQKSDASERRWCSSAPGWGLCVIGRKCRQWGNQGTIFRQIRNCRKTVGCIMRQRFSPAVFSRTFPI